LQIFGGPPFYSQTQEGLAAPHWQSLGWPTHLERGAHVLCQASCSCQDKDVGHASPHSCRGDFSVGHSDDW
jgi:hypothetical protein